LTLFNPSLFWLSPLPNSFRPFSSEHPRPGIFPSRVINPPSPIKGKVLDRWSLVAFSPPSVFSLRESLCGLSAVTLPSVQATLRLFPTQGFRPPLRFSLHGEFPVLKESAPSRGRWDFSVSLSWNLSESRCVFFHPFPPLLVLFFSPKIVDSRRGQRYPFPFLADSTSDLPTLDLLFPGPVHTTLLFSSPLRLTLSSPVFCILLRCKPFLTFLSIY